MEFGTGGECGTGLEFTLLGDVQAVADGRPLPLGPARQRSVLVALLIDAGHVVTVDTLMERVWGDGPPQRARGTLHAYLSRLRNAFGPGRQLLARRPGGYALLVDPLTVDLNRFRAHTAAARRTGDDRAREALFGRALSLWRGEACAGLETAWISGLREVLHQERFLARLDHADVRLRLGDHTRLVSELSALADRYPLDERLAGQLMLALYRSGRSADALQHFHVIRARLAEELGCDPGPALRTLHRRLLTNDPALTAPATEPPAAEAPPAIASPPSAPSARGRLVGRSAELRTLTGLLDDFVTQDGARDAAPLGFDILGEPGMGKTRLLDEVVRAARDRGLTVLHSTGAPSDPHPYGVIVEALADAVTAGERRLRAALPTATVRVLGTLFPVLADGPATVPGPATTERHWLHRSLASLLETLAMSDRTVLVIDDLHAADEATSELIAYLLRRPVRARLLLALAHRPRQITPRLEQALARSAAEGRLVRSELAPLSRADAQHLCPSVRGRRRLAWMYEVSGGNPLYLECLARLPPHTAVGTGDRPAGPADPHGHTDGLPGAVRADVLAELSGLPAATVTVARAAAVLGDPFDAAGAAAVAGTAFDETLTALDALAARDLVRATGDAQRFRFRHPLVRTAVYEGADAGWLIGAHIRAEEALRLAGAPPSARAVHVLCSARAGDDAAAALLARAARDVLSTSPSTSARWTEQALRLLPPEVPRPDLWAQRTDALHRAGHLRESREFLRTVMPRLPAGAAEQHARLVVSLATTEWLLGEYDGAIGLLLEELSGAVTHSPGTTADLQAAVASVAVRTADFDTAVRWARRSLRSATCAGSAPQRNAALGLLALARTSAGDYTAARADLERASAALEQLADEELQDHLGTCVTVGWSQMLWGHHHAALRTLDRALRMSYRTGHHVLLCDLFAAAAYAYLFLGRLDEADAHAEDALEAASFTGSDEPSSLAGAVKAAVRLWRGQVEEARRICTSMVPSQGSDRGPSTARAVALGVLGQTMLLTGDPDGCAALTLRAGGGVDLGRFEAPMRPLWYSVLTGAALARDDPGQAAEWSRRAAESADPDGPRHQHGFVALTRAENLLARRDGAPAARLAHEAAELFDANAMSVYAASARLTAGRAWFVDARPDLAREQLLRARRQAQECGAHALGQAAESLLADPGA
ncbi:BTAD domain-containing putative transcriptional regulator [Streptomyces tricolor]|uniref:BTAD domain-containing putative transcriptional regulator n=1 Tax=Streptomyces tricolor TaxID=68277 RepID=UPI003D707C61